MKEKIKSDLSSKMELIAERIIYRLTLVIIITQISFGVAVSSAMIYLHQNPLEQRPHQY
jgi:hypothetical protein